MSCGLEWKIAERDDVVTVSLVGPLSEEADFDLLIKALEGLRGASRAAAIRLDLFGIAKVTSWGVREWLGFIRALPKDRELQLSRCPPSVVTQLNVISNFAGDARILSVQAPYICEACGNEENVLVELDAGAPSRLGSIRCGSCGGQMQFDDVEESYFAFMS